MSIDAAEIRRLVDEAPPLTAAQISRLRAVITADPSQVPAEPQRAAS